jgi:CBS domain containing-hemolysin-like protein
MIALLIAAGGAVVATILAAAESSLLTPEGEPPSLSSARPGIPPLYERTYRALSIARLVVHLLVGVAGAVAMRSFGVAGLLLAAIGAVVALLVAAVSEGAGRRLGMRQRGRPAWLHPVNATIGGLLAPVASIDVRLDRALASVFPPIPAEDVERDATDQFRRIVAAEATVTRGEAQLITGVFSLGDTPVRDVMVPRVDVVGIERTLPWSEVVDRVRSSEHSRFPVFDETLDDVLGLLFAKDLLPSVIADQPPERGWLSLLRPPTYIPQTKLVDEQLRHFQATGTQMAIVVDEYGGTAGVVTIEDILEEIVGEIQDEYDVEEPAIEQEDGRRFWVAGRVPLDELAEVVGHEFAHAESSTVGGLIFERLGRVPRAGEQLAIDGFRVVVERVIRRRVERVYFERETAIGARESR